MRNLKRIKISTMISLSIILMTGGTTINLNEGSIFSISEAAGHRTFKKGDTAYVDVNSYLNVRKGAGTGYNRVAALSRGQKVYVLGNTSKNGWTQIKIPAGYKDHITGIKSKNDIIGYVYSDNLTKTDILNQKANSSKVPSVKLTPQFQMKVDTGKGTTRLNVRKEAMPNGTIIGSLKNGAKINIFGSVAGWYKVCVNGQYGWSSMAHFTSINSRSIQDPSNVEEVIEEELINDISRLRKNELLTVTTQGGALNLREKASSESSVQILGKLDNDSKVEALDQDGDWVKVKVVQSNTVTKGKEGWISLKYINHGELDRKSVV